MTTDEPPAPAPRRRGCLVGLLLAVGVLVAAVATLSVKRIEIGLWLVRRGIDQQTWTAPTRERARSLLERTGEAFRSGEISEDEELGLRRVMGQLDEAAADGVVSEEEAGPLLEAWEGWLDEVAQE